MSEAVSLAELAGEERPVDRFLVGNVIGDELSVSAEQYLGRRLTDHRGLIDLPALAFLFDHVCGLPFYRSIGPDAGSVQARLSLSMCGPVSVAQNVVAHATLARMRGEYGAASVDIRDADGAVCCIGTARSVRVGRPTRSDPFDLDGLISAGEDFGPTEVISPEVDDGYDGVAIVRKIAAGIRAPGPIVELVSGHLYTVSGRTPREAIRFGADTSPWMANTFGTMHGGIIATIVAQACSLAAQAHTAPGQQYRLDDFAVGFFRSPAVDGREVVVDVVPIKTGRRIVSFEARMVGPDGTLLSCGSADAYFD